MFSIVFSDKKRSDEELKEMDEKNKITREMVRINICHVNKGQVIIIRRINIPMYLYH